MPDIMRNNVRPEKIPHIWMHRRLSCAFVEFGSERAYLRAGRDAQVLALEIICAELTSRFFQNLFADQVGLDVYSRTDTRPGLFLPRRPRWVRAAPRGSQH